MYHRIGVKLTPPGQISDRGRNLDYTKNFLVDERGTKSQGNIHPSYHQLHEIKGWKGAQNPEHCVYTILCGFGLVT